MSLLDVITGGKSSEATGDLEKALQDIQGVGTPTAQSMKYELQKLVQAGVLTPQQAQTYLQGPNALATENVDQTGTDAQQKAIAELLAAAKNGGLNPAEEAATQKIIGQLSTQERGANNAVVQRQAERGALTSGETLAAQLEGNQTADVNANQLASAEAGNAYEQMLKELTSAGSAGATLQGQENTQANTVAEATNAINQFNTAQQQQEENFNTTNKNDAQKFNVENLQGIENANTEAANTKAAHDAQLPQQVFSDQMQKAAAEAGVSENQAENATTQGGQQAGLIGGLIGTGGDVVAAKYAQPVKADEGGLIESIMKGGDPVPGPEESIDVYKGKDDRTHAGYDWLAESGGEVPGEAEVSGDSPRNDKVPALLSPGEVVLPRSVARNPQPTRVMDFLKRMRPAKPAHPDDVATVLHALGTIRGVA